MLLRHKVIAERLLLSGAVHEHEGVDALILLIGETGGRMHGGIGCGDIGVGGHELFDFRGLGRVRRAGGDGQEQVAEIRGIGDGKEFQRVDDKIAIASVRQMELHRDAVRVGVRGRHRGYSARPLRRKIAPSAGLRFH